MDAVETTSTGPLVDLLPKLGGMLGDEYNLHKDVKEGISYIQKELESIQVALHKVSEMPPDQLQVKLWAKKVRDMSYQIEDTIDSYLVTVNPSAEPESSTGTSWALKARHDIAKDIERITEEVEELAKHTNMYGVYGIDHSTKKIMELLSMKLDHQAGSTSSSSEEELDKMLRLVAIVGPGGMGKTTLANEVYQKLRDQFDCTAFVSVSLNPNLENILRSILRQVNSTANHVSKDKSILSQEGDINHGNADNWSEKEVIDKIREVLKDKRYLIVIDDICYEPAWEDFECVFVPNRLGSRIITTTRDTYFAKICCSRDNVDGTIYQLGPLSSVESEKLFYNKVFGRGMCPPELKDISRKILDKCKGLPLAIVSIAGLLAHNKEHTEDQWVGVYNSIGIWLENRQRDIQLILSLTYSDMSSQLKACFLYLSMFSEDHVIGRHDLIWRWVAEGFVHGKQDDNNNNLYEVGDAYFNELINRNMIQPAKVDTLGKAQACTVNAIVLKFINSLSAEEDFAMILTGHGQPFPFERDNSIHRLSLLNSEEEHGVPKTVKRLPHVRTLVVSSWAATSMPSLSIFPLLRVLDLEDCTSHNIKDVGILVLLRYLKLSQGYYGSHHIELPQGIGALQFLQIFDLKDARIQRLPTTLVQLTQLRVVKLSLYSWGKRDEKCLIQCLSNLKKLETLYISTPVNVSLDFMLRVDWPTPYLRIFMARFHEQNEHILKPGSVWRELSSFSALPRWINSSLSRLLSDLSVTMRKLEQRDVEILAQFPILVSLEMEVVEAYKEGRLVISGHETSFQCLSNLKFASRVMGLLFTPGAMQKLHKLYLCFSLAQTEDAHDLKDKDFHFGLENLTSLKAVEVEIDCRCAWRGELEAAEDALRTATKLNPNQPAFVLRKHFEREMMSKAVFSEHEWWSSRRVEDALAELCMGGNGGVARDISSGDVHMPTNMSLAFLQQITNGFSDDREIGTGGFAVVYKGILRDGSMVAVKKLNPILDMDEKKFNQEVEALMKTKHKNVVRFLGYCADTQGKGMKHEGKFILADSRNRLLCFEYVPNGSLDKYITDAFRGLEWRDRYQIIKGIVQGLHYLHDKRILHLDLKPANILIDATMTPKIADFGLSRCFDDNQTRAVTTKLIGSAGYLAPELLKYNSKPQITFKLDIFSLGVIIMEILTGDKGYSATEDVVENWKNRLKLDTLQVEQVRVCTEIGIQCIKADPAKRPLTPHIIQMLDNSSVETSTNNTTTSSAVQAGLYKIGPCGGNGGMDYDIGVPPHRLETITIHSGHVVDSLAFSYIDHNGHQFNAGPWGGRGGDVSTIPLGPSEYLKRVSGQTGTYFEDHIVKSLTFVTNVASYGPFGIHSGENQFVVEARRNNCIVGFFSNAGQYVNSIGFYACPL